ncbi:MAG: uridine kinase [Microbacteriaceae bacterium]
MELISTQKIEFLRGLVAEITHNYATGRVIVAVDGIAGSGTEVFADAMAEVFRESGRETFRASIEDFHRSRFDRHLEGADLPAGYYRDSYDYRTLRRVLIDPFRMAGSTGFQTAAFSVATDAAVEARWQTAGANAVLIIDGVFLNRPELRGAWNYSVYLEVPWGVAYVRLAEQRAVDPDPNAESNARYRLGQDLYLAEAFPRGAASAIVDNTDPERPTREFADSC